MPEIRPILLAEDNANDVELTLTALQAHHIANDVIVVRDGSEALDYSAWRGLGRAQRTATKALSGLSETSSALPGHDAVTRGQLLFSVLSIAVAFLLLGWVGGRVAARLDLWQWWIPLALFGGIAAADFGSGLIHWAADTWGHDDFPFIGRRLLVPFRVHHINPDDFLRRSFVDTNGDVALLAIPVLLALVAVPLDSEWGGPIVVFGFGLCGIGSMTNQIHQWSHMPSPPWPIGVLQSCGLLLDRDEHAAHHERPYDCHYCITTGWCNRPLEAIGFFRRLEVVITRVTGVIPRQDDRRYEERYGVPPTRTEPRRG